MSIITLITDLGLKDHFVGVLKGKIHSLLPNTNVIDISHDVEKFNTIHAGYLLATSYFHFPKNTIHIINVDVAATKDSKQVFFKCNDHFFIGNNNGMFNYLFKEHQPEQVIEIYNSADENLTDIDLFLKTAKHISENRNWLEIGQEINLENKQYLFEPVVDLANKKIKGNIIYIDDFGNCVTNITKEIVSNNFNKAPFSVSIRKRKILKTINHFNDFKEFDDAKIRSLEGKDMAYFNEAGFLEICIFKGNPTVTGGANKLLGLNFKDVVEIEINN
jgi:S-adenosylmethionine hydrolase